ncbi:transposable element Tcb2 transposase [Trichonephila clavipes]|nr:transposable element Tcb2 transposase [Trichonephila clavipes]
MANHRRLHLQWTHKHGAWQAHWHPVVFSDESCFNLWDHDGRIRVRRYDGIPGALFQQDVAKTVRDFCPAQYMQLLPWPVYSPDMSPIEHVWDLVGRCLTRDPLPAASKDELLRRI